MDDACPRPRRGAGSPLARAVLVVGTALFGYAILSGGVRFQLLGREVSVHHHLRPVLLFGGLLAVYLGTCRRDLPAAVLRMVRENDRALFRRARLRLTAATVFLPLLFVYLAVPRFTEVGDSTPARYLPASLIREGDFDLDEFFPSAGEGNAPAYFLKEHGGRLYSLYPVFGPVCATPLYALASVLNPAPFSELRLQALEKLSAALFTACSAVFLFLACLERTTLRRAYLLAAVYGLGTSAWSTASQLMWQHGPGLCFTNLSLLLLLRGERSPRLLGWAGLPMACAVAARPTNAIFYAVIFLLLLRRRPRSAAWAALASVPVGLFLLAYSWGHFGGWMGFYFPQNAEGTAAEQAARWLVHLGVLFPVGMLGTLISPSRGLFVFSPVLLFSLWGMRLERRSPGLWLHPSLAWVAVLHWLLISAWPMWWGGHSYGPRLLVDVVPILILYLVPVLDALEARGRLRRLFAASLVASVCIQAVGVYTSAGQWNVHADVDRNPASLFRPLDSQILYPLLH